MRVVQATRFGGPEVLVAADAPDPVAGPGQVVVDISVAEVLFLDTQLRSGWGRQYFPLQPPYVLGTGVAGMVSSVGDGVDAGWVGRRVVASTGKGGQYVGGGYAQRAAVPADEVFEVPEQLDLTEALAALHDGLMALSRVEKAAIAPGKWVLVSAAGGSLGASGAFAEIDPHDAQQRQITVISIQDRITPEDGKRLTERALSELSAGRVRPVIGQTLPLERAADAHAAIEARSVTGKTLLLT